MSVMLGSCYHISDQFGFIHLFLWGPAEIGWEGVWAGPRYCKPAAWWHQRTSPVWQHSYQGYFGLILLQRAGSGVAMATFNYVIGKHRQT